MIRAGSLWTFPDIPRFPTRWGADDRFQRPHGAFDTQITARLSHRTGGTRLIWLWNNVGNLTQKLIFINFPTMWNMSFETLARYTCPCHTWGYFSFHSVQCCGGRTRPLKVLLFSRRPRTPVIFKVKRGSWEGFRSWQVEIGWSSR